MIRALVVEDSDTVRQLLVRMLQDDPEIRVIGAARDGLEAVEMAHRLHPDVITMDIQMPRLDGLQATKRIMQQVPTPIIVVSAAVHSDLEVAFNATRAGALTVIEKPGGPAGPDYATIRDHLITTVKLMADVKVVRRWTTGFLERREPILHPRPREVQTAVVCMAASTGGPAAFYQLLKELPGDFPVPILIVQHITRGFGRGMVKWLDGTTQLVVEIAADGQELSAGRVLVAPDDQHLTIGADGNVRLQPPAASDRICPSADLLFASAAHVLGRKALAVIMTGMGRDGAEGLKQLKAAGGRVVAQDERSCIVFGMSKEAIEAGVVDRVEPLERLATTVLEML
ncbi:MAG: chemotaxis-specific protein-glutamate methyltransferase CheB [Anaerolineae bacterium]|nr:chemotaxis-specific protein-glutamate methyltransferase CheB [Anaerolineae bacterium]